MADNRLFWGKLVSGKLSPGTTVMGAILLINALTLNNCAANISQTMINGPDWSLDE
jgi:hypothetical protein